jgi:hypothetical protein
MIRCITPKLLLSAAASLLPLWAPGESQMVNLEQRSAAVEARASVHVMFKVVIPEVLSLDLAEARPQRILLSRAGPRFLARVESCVPLEAAQAARGVSCTISTP